MWTSERVLVGGSRVLAPLKHTTTRPRTSGHSRWITVSLRLAVSFRRRREETTRLPPTNNTTTKDQRSNREVDRARASVDGSLLPTSARSQATTTSIASLSHIKHHSLSHIQHRLLTSSIAYSHLASLTHSLSHISKWVRRSKRSEEVEEHQHHHQRRHRLETRRQRYRGTRSARRCPMAPRS